MCVREGLREGGTEEPSRINGSDIFPEKPGHGHVDLRLSMATKLI